MVQAITLVVTTEVVAVPMMEVVAVVCHLSLSTREVQRLQAITEAPQDHIYALANRVWQQVNITVVSVRMDIVVVVV